MTSEGTNSGRRQNVVLLTASLVIALVIAEIAARSFLHPAPVQEWDHTEISEVRPNNVHDILILGESNSMGLREDREYGPHFEGYRILAVGDSFTYGYKLFNKHSWPKLTEQILNRQGKGEFQVLNGGRPGTDTRWQVDFFRDHTSAINPDMVVIGFIINDCTTLCSHCGAVKSKVKLDEFMAREPYWFHSALLRQIQLVLLKRQLSMETIAEFEQPYHDHSPDLLRCQDAFREFRDLTHSRNFELVVVIIPMMYQLHDDHPFLSIHQQMLDFWENEGIAAYDLTPAFYGYRDTDLWIQPTDSHPNGKAQEIIASLVARIVRQHTSP